MVPNGNASVKLADTLDFLNCLNKRRMKPFPRKMYIGTNPNVTPQFVEFTAGLSELWGAAALSAVLQKLAALVGGWGGTL